MWTDTDSPSGLATEFCVRVYHDIFQYFVFKRTMIIIILLFIYLIFYNIMYIPLIVVNFLEMNFLTQSCSIPYSPLSAKRQRSRRLNRQFSKVRCDHSSRPKRNKHKSVCFLLIYFLWKFLFWPMHVATLNFPKKKLNIEKIACFPEYG